MRVWSSLRARLRAGASDARGATAVEFALIATPFFMIVCGLMELVLIFLMSVSLENSLGSAAREIRTGILQTSNLPTGSTQTPAQNFIAKVCDGLGWMATDCKSKLRIDVSTYASLSATNNQSAPITNKTWNAGSGSFSCGAAGSIVLVRAYYEWGLIAPGFDSALEKINGGKTVISAASAFVTEPYGTVTAGTASC